MDLEATRTTMMTTRMMQAVLDKSTAADIAAALVFSRLDYANSVLYGSLSRCLTRLQPIQNSLLQGSYYSSHHYPHGTHFSNFIVFLSNGGYSLSRLILSTKSYTPVHRHIRLNASIPTFLLAPCDHPPPLTCSPSL